MSPARPVPNRQAWQAWEHVNVYAIYGDCYHQPINIFILVMILTRVLDFSLLNMHNIE